MSDCEMTNNEVPVKRLPRSKKRPAKLLDADSDNELTSLEEVRYDLSRKLQLSFCMTDWLSRLCAI